MCEYMANLDEAAGGGCTNRTDKPDNNGDEVGVEEGYKELDEEVAHRLEMLLDPWQ